MLSKMNCWKLGAFLGIILITCFGLATICTAQGAPRGGPGEALGFAQSIQGAAVVQRAGVPEFHALAEKDPVFLQDLIGTDPGLETRLW